jgi:hypothetical protein
VVPSALPAPIVPVPVGPREHNAWVPAAFVLSQAVLHTDCAGARLCVARFAAHVALVILAAEAAVGELALPFAISLARHAAHNAVLGAWPTDSQYRSGAPSYSLPSVSHRLNMARIYDQLRLFLCTASRNASSIHSYG